MCSAAKVGPDISEMKLSNQFLWVEAAIVMPKSPMVWQATIEELHVKWDYEGKIETSCWSKAQGSKMLYHRIRSPLARMIRIFLAKAADAIVNEVMGATSWPSTKTPKGPTVGLTKGVSFSPLEANANTRVAAIQVDDAEVDLFIWALPDETIEQSKAYEALRWFATKWWAYNLSKKAWKWWHMNGMHPEDAEAISDFL